MEKDRKAGTSWWPRVQDVYHVTATGSLFHVIPKSLFSCPLLCCELQEIKTKYPALPTPPTKNKNKQKNREGN